MFPVGLTIAVYRSLKGITAKEVAKEIGISRGFLSILELGLRLPPVSLDFTKATAKFLNVSETVLLSSISCEHFLASIKNFSWLAPLISSAVSNLFTTYYLYPEDSSPTSFYVLQPHDKFRIPVLKHIIEKKLVPIGTEAFINKEIDLNERGKTFGILKNIKPYLYNNPNLFSVNESLIFFDSFGVESTVTSDEPSYVFHFVFHTPLSKPSWSKDHYSVGVYINPFNENPIDIFPYPVTFSKDNIRDS